MGKKRTRLTLESLPEPDATFNEKNPGHEFEGYLLGEDVDAVPFPHWTAHLREFFGWYDEKPDYRTSANHVPAVMTLITAGLERAGFSQQGTELSNAASSDDLNRILVQQYTQEGRFYREVNAVLRRAHVGANLESHALAPWVLQFNSAIRQQAIYDGVCYRGARFTPEDVAKYQPGLMFEWAGFISASRDRETAIDTAGNVIFEITPWGSYSMYGKRNPLDISALSVMPDEQEVIFPMACTFHVKTRSLEGHRTVIALETVDQY